MGGHAGGVACDKPGIVKKCRGHVAGLHAALGFPAHVLDLVRREVLVADDGGGAVVLLQVFIFDEAETAKLVGHRGSRVRRGVLDVGPVDILAGEGEVGLDGLGGVVGAADDEASDDVHLVAMEVFDGLECCVAGVLAVSAGGVFCGGAEGS